MFESSDFPGLRPALKNVEPGMPTTESYDFFYTLSGDPGSGFSISSEFNIVTILNDNDSNPSDGSTVPGDPIDWNGSFGPETLVGFSASGDPVILDDFGEYYLLSDTGSQSGDIGFIDSGTYTFCFAGGTRIATPGGGSLVETLEVGDSVITARGQEVTVKWIGRQTVGKLFAGPHMQPVRIRAGALGGGLPHSDLTVTADHGMVLDGLVINASALINGTTIDWVPMEELPDRVTYYHIETEDHDVILANGAPAETFVDCVGRQAFDNYQEYVDLYGAERIIPEMDRPRITSRRLLPEALKARLGIVEPQIDWNAPLTA